MEAIICRERCEAATAGREKGGAGGFGGRILRAHFASFLRAVSRKSLISLICFGCAERRAGEAERGRCVRGNWTQEVAILLDVQASELHGKA